MIHVILIAQLAATAATTKDPAQQLILAADISPSQDSEVLRGHADLASALVTRLSFGDRLVVLQVREKGASAADRGRSLTAPQPKNPRKILASDRRQLSAFHKTALRMTKEVIDPNKSAALTNTDLLATLQLAGQHVQDKGMRKPVLVIMSDMLQTVGSFNFEREAPPGSDWIQRQKAEGLIPDLRGACVIVVGADVTTPHALQIKKFWEEYLRAANARVEQYRMIAADPSALGCGL
jgi:hypothetical protein